MKSVHHLDAIVRKYQRDNLAKASRELDAFRAMSFEEAWRARTLPPQLEAMIWHYAYGRPGAATERASAQPTLASNRCGHS